MIGCWQLDSYLVVVVVGIDRVRSRDIADCIDPRPRYFANPILQIPPQNDDNSLHFPFRLHWWWRSFRLRLSKVDGKDDDGVVLVSLLVERVEVEQEHVGNAFVVGVEDVVVQILVLKSVDGMQSRRG